jgi:Na+-translocating ferredoxin:NAD+ oxidoreductase subunit B
MAVETYLIPILSMGGMGAVLASLLVLADSRLQVEEDPKIGAIESLLPGANCGACGIPGCRQFAEQLVGGEQSPSGCNACGPETAVLIGEILGVEVEAGVPLKARVACLGGKAECGSRAIYHGVKDCRAAALVGGGDKGCIYGCLGYGSCVEACPFGAMKMNANGLPEIDDRCCTGCGLCVAACPKTIIKMAPETDKIALGCSSPEKGKAVKLACSRGCFGCSLCAKVCPQQAIVMENNLPRIDQDKCDGCGDCVKRCPTDSLLGVLLNQVLAAREKKHVG